MGVGLLLLAVWELSVLVSRAALERDGSETGGERGKRREWGLRDPHLTSHAHEVPDTSLVIKLHIVHTLSYHMRLCIFTELSWKICSCAL